MLPRRHGLIHQHSYPLPEDVEPYRAIVDSTAYIAAGHGLVVASLWISPVTDVDDEALPANFELSQNYPNPFNPVTRIQFALKEQGNVVLTVYSVLGEQINVLVDESLQIGLHEVEFSGNNLPSGVYYYQLQFQSQESGTGYSEIKKMMLLK